MKAKINSGHSFGGLLRYLSDHGQPKICGGTMAADNPRDMAREFGQIRGLRPDIDKPVWHGSLSLPPGDCLTDEQWADVAADFLGRMGLDADRHQWTAVKHSDHDHSHVHIVVNRIGTDGQVWNDWQSIKRAISVTREMERERPELCDTSHLDGTDKTFRPTKAEAGRQARGGDVERQFITDNIRSILDGAKGQTLTTAEFIAQCQQRGIGIEANVASTGRMNGLSFSHNGSRYTGSKVKAKWNDLIAEIDYSPERDRAVLDSIRGQSAVKKDLTAAVNAYADSDDGVTYQQQIADIDKGHKAALARLSRQRQNELWDEMSALYARRRVLKSRAWRARSRRRILNTNPRDLAGAAIFALLCPGLVPLILLPLIVRSIARAGREPELAEINSRLGQCRAQYDAITAKRKQIVPQRQHEPVPAPQRQHEPQPTPVQPEIEAEAARTQGGRDSAEVRAARDSDFYESPEYAGLSAARATWDKLTAGGAATPAEIEQMTAVYDGIFNRFEDATAANYIPYSYAEQAGWFADPAVEAAFAPYVYNRLDDDWER